MNKPPRKKKTVAQRAESVALTPLQALELRLLEFQVSTAQAALQHIINIRNIQAQAIATSLGIDLSQGSWHIDTDAGRISKRQEG